MQVVSAAIIITKAGRRTALFTALRINETAALEFAFVLENQAAYTYAGALTLLQDPQYAAATSTIVSPLDRRRGCSKSQSCRRCSSDRSTS